MGIFPVPHDTFFFFGDFFSDVSVFLWISCSCVCFWVTFVFDVLFLLFGEVRRGCCLFFF